MIDAGAAAVHPARLPNAGKDDRAMHRYRAELFDDGTGCYETITFEAADTATALERLAPVVTGKRAELWEDGQFLCTLKEEEDAQGVWKLG
ncbi:hypothetical protein [Croceicoccus gelatinilyticus]|uniref:hypothetical protein n=1 Tax=Croceicoccus gelatinilyticus TaxID=2835536 RepID=UPI001BCC2A51|nr:hypothetical protein [Croceicoccus gelatinilyticus]MBS7668141.1 hypothetical protein [Croceicoccus gelatinilyticus]